MSKFNEQALREAGKVVSSLAAETSKGKTFQFESFICNLGEEIADLWESGSKSTFVCFRLVENGDLVYDGLNDFALKDPVNFSFPITLKEETVVEKTVDVFSLREKHNQEKAKIVEDLDKLSSNFDKLLIETVKVEHENKKKESTSIREAEDVINKDIALKKQKLLEKLLEGK